MRYLDGSRKARKAIDMTTRKPNLPKDTLRGQEAPASAIIPAPSLAQGGMDYTPFL
jgi:hypothetical protein